METRWLHRRGFTLIELLTVIAVLSVLGAILFPVFVRAKARSQAMSCLSNTKQVGLSAILYSQDSEGALPPPNWYYVLSPYTGNLAVFVCPSAERYAVSYSMNVNIQGWAVDRIQDPSRVILFGDGYQDPNRGWVTAPIYAEEPDPTSRGYRQVDYRHDDGANFTFCDGHAKWYAKGELRQDMWHPEILR